MKKVFYLLLGLVLTMGMISCGGDDPDPRWNGGGNHGGGGGNNNEAYTFTANDLWAGYYGDHFGYGTGVYLVQLTQGTVDDQGNLTGTGNSIMLAISNKLLSNTNNLTLPEGTYKANGNKKQSYTIYNGLNADDQYNSWLEVWVKNEKESELYFIDSGTLTIEKTSGGKYKITADVDVFYYDNNDKVVDAGEVVATYTGNVNVEDCTSGVVEDPYEPLTTNVNLGDMTDMDCYFYRFKESLLGNYFMRIYDVTFDKNNNVNSEGYILTLDLCTDYSSEPDLNMINGEYKVAVLDEFVENSFQPGYVYFDEEENDYVWWGTYVDEIIKTSEGYAYGRAGLITGGKFTASHEGGDLILQFDFITENGKKVNGSYRGKPTVQDEGSLDWAKARKIKGESKYNIMPFAKYSKRTPAKQSRRTGVSARQAQGNALLFVQP